MGRRLGGTIMVPPWLGGAVQALPSGWTLPICLGVTAEPSVYPSAFNPPRLKAISCRIFAPAQPAYPAASLRDFLSRAYTVAGDVLEELRAEAAEVLYAA
jgi:hypothetical protein